MGLIGEQRRRERCLPEHRRPDDADLAEVGLAGEGGLAEVDPLFESASRTDGGPTTRLGQWLPGGQVRLADPAERSPGAEGSSQVAGRPLHIDVVELRHVAKMRSVKAHGPVKGGAAEIGQGRQRGVREIKVASKGCCAEQHRASEGRTGAVDRTGDRGTGEIDGSGKGDVGHRQAIEGAIPAEDGGGDGVDAAQVKRTNDMDGVEVDRFVLTQGLHDLGGGHGRQGRAGRRRSRRDGEEARREDQPPGETHGLSIGPAPPGGPDPGGSRRAFPRFSSSTVLYGANLC